MERMSSTTLTANTNQNTCTVREYEHGESTTVPIFLANAEPSCVYSDVHGTGELYREISCDEWLDAQFQVALKAFRLMIEPLCKDEEWYRKIDRMIADIQNETRTVALSRFKTSLSDFEFYVIHHCINQMLCSCMQPMHFLAKTHHFPLETVRSGMDVYFRQIRAHVHEAFYHYNTAIHGASAPIADIITETHITASRDLTTGHNDETMLMPMQSSFPYIETTGAKPVVQPARSVLAVDGSVAVPAKYHGSTATSRGRGAHSHSNDTCA